MTETNATEVYVKVHIECRFRNEQEDGDDFQLYMYEGDGFWLSEAEVRELRDKLDAALATYAASNSRLGNGPRV